MYNRLGDIMAKDMSVFSRRLKELREKKGLTQERLGNILKISRKTISSYESGKAQPPIDTLHKLAQILDTSTDYLLGLTNDPRPWSERLGIIMPEEGEKIIPVYNSACAGNSGSYPDGNTIVEYLKISSDIPAQFGVIVHGDSMEPEIYDGDIVLVNKDFYINNNDRVLAIIGEPYFKEPHALIKIYRESPDGHKYLVSRNEKYPPILLNGAEVTLIAKVVEVRRRYH